MIVEAWFHLVKTGLQVQDRPPVLDGDDTASAEASSVADAVDLVENGNAGIARPQEICVQRVDVATRFFDGTTGCYQRLAGDLAAEHSLTVFVGLHTTKDVDLDRFEVEQRDEIAQRFGHLAMLPRRTVLYDIPVMNIVIRDAVAADLGAIVGLLNAFVSTTTHEYTDTPHTVSSRASWFARQALRDFPVLVAEKVTETGSEVVGYAAYGDFRDSVARPGYRFVVEHSVHVAEDAWGIGVGRLLMESLIDRAAAHGVRTMVGAIDASNTGSIQFHRGLGFVETGRMPDVGYKHGQWLELVLMQRPVAT